MSNILKILGGVAFVVLLADMLGFALWVMSGQYPVDEFYLGTITAHVLRAIL